MRRQHSATLLNRVRNVGPAVQMERAPPLRAQVFSLYNEAREFIQEAEASYDCQDFHVSEGWAVRYDPAGAQA